MRLAFMLFWLLLTAAAFPVATAQILSLQQLELPYPPVVFNDTVVGEAVLLFFPQQLERRQDCRVRLTRLSTRDSVPVVQFAATDTMPTGGAVPRVLTHFRHADQNFLLVEVRDECRLYRVDGKMLTLNLLSTRMLDRKNHEFVLASVANDGEALVLGRLGTAMGSNKRLSVSRFRVGGEVERHIYRLPAKSALRGDGTNNTLYLPDFQVLPINPGAEHPFVGEDWPGRLFAGPDKLWLTVDDYRRNVEGEFTEAYYKVYTVDLKRDTLETLTSFYLPDTQEGRSQEASSYVLDDKLFQFYADRRRLAFFVRRPDDGSILFQKTVETNDPMDFSVMMRDSLGKQPFQDTRGFISTVLNHSSGLVVQRAGNDYIVQLNGYRQKVGFSGQNIKSAFLGGPMAVNVSYFGVDFSITSSEPMRVSARADDRPRLAEAIFQTMNDAVQRVETAWRAVRRNVSGAHYQGPTTPQAPAIVTLGRHRYLGYYVGFQWRYCFDRLKDF